MRPFPETKGDWWVFYFLKNGGVVKYWKPTILARDCQRLEAMGYQLDQFNCLEWTDEDAMHKQLKERLGFPDYYGENLAALNDCIHGNLEIPEDSGRVLILNRFDAFNTIEPQLAWDILDTFARTTYRHLIRGKRFFVFLQSDDPTLTFRDVGKQYIRWNQKEWLHKDRGL